MKNVVYDFSSVLLDVPEPLSAEIVDWGLDKVPEKTIFKRPGFGREDDIHITVLYGLHSNSPEQTKQIAVRQAPIEVTLGRVTVFDNKPDYDVIVVEVESEHLHQLNKEFKREVVYTNRYSSYKPHITIAYIHKFAGWNVCGDDTFLGKKFIADQVVFSSRDGTKERIDIG